MDKHVLEITMPRTARLINKEGKTAYHLISRTALDGFPVGDVEKDMLVEIVKNSVVCSLWMCLDIV